MADISKTTADKLQFSRAVEDALSVHGAVVAAKFSAWLFGAAEPRALRVEELLALLQARLHEDGEALADADLAHQVELGDDVEPRGERDARIAELRDCLVSASDVVRGTFGVSYSRSVGLEAPLAERADLLVKQARTIARLLRETAPPEGRRKAPRGVSVTDEATILDDAANAAETAVGSVKKEETEAQKSLLARDAADARWAATFTCAGDVLAAIAITAGVGGVAERVKTNWRRRAGIADPSAGGGKRKRDGGAPVDDPTGEDGPFLPDLPSPFIDEDEEK